MSTPTTGAGFLTQGGAAPTENQHRVSTDRITVNPHASPLSPSFPGSNASRLDNMLSGNTMEFNAVFDSSTAVLYNFDLEALKFGSQSAGWEFDIVNKIGLGTETCPRENMMSQTTSTEANYAETFGTGAGADAEYNALLGSDCYGMDSGHSTCTQPNLQHGLPQAYAIPTGPHSLPSVGTSATASPQAATDTFHTRTETHALRTKSDHNPDASGFGA
ncbi:alternative oxidase-5 [Purpureocillium lavendulum]|uniref:Alternative oxidase-5 n=1 Tax=Purpureocillium lavendulum TaxID=1247861 RepID=A0AB34FBC4_9HYPO|nr:alternative oxidase-5 [Purpureocillium lavendulum]